MQSLFLLLFSDQLVTSNSQFGWVA
jgi:hypothetical protein